MRRAAVLGFPVAHSLSPKLHGYWLSHHRIEGTYEAIATAPQDLADTLARLADAGYEGCNLTLPHKEAALALMDDLDGSASAAGAVNTVHFENGKMEGYNSDGFGFIESLKAQGLGWQDATVMIVGAGGAARAIIHALSTAGARDFIIVNRTLEKAEQLARDLNIYADVRDWSGLSSALEKTGLLVNCTNLGMAGQDPLVLDLQRLNPLAGVADIVYKPLETDLLKSARKRGHKVATGLPMLIHQGRLGFKLWFGVDPEVTADLQFIMEQAAQ